MKPEFLELNIKNKAIHCSSCEARIQTLLSDELGIIKIAADHKTQKVKLYFDKEKINPAKIKLILEVLGFPVS